MTQVAGTQAVGDLIRMDHAKLSDDLGDREHSLASPLRHQPWGS